jgi:hypothetical protein
LLEPRPRQIAQHGFGELANHDWFDRSQPNAPRHGVFHRERPVHAREQQQEDGASTPIPIGIGDVSQERALWRALRFDAGPAPRM